jgi:hypothetical protein
MKVSYQPPPLGTLPSVKDLIPFSGIADDSSGTCAARERKKMNYEGQGQYKGTLRARISRYPKGGGGLKITTGKSHA